MIVQPLGEQISMGPVFTHYFSINIMLIYMLMKINLIYISSSTNNLLIMSFNSLIGKKNKEIINKKQKRVIDAIQ